MVGRPFLLYQRRPERPAVAAPGAQPSGLVRACRSPQAARRAHRPTADAKATSVAPRALRQAASSDRRQNASGGVSRATGLRRSRHLSRPGDPVLSADDGRGGFCRHRRTQAAFARSASDAAARRSLAPRAAAARRAMPSRARRWPSAPAGAPALKAGARSRAASCRTAGGGPQPAHRGRRVEVEGPALSERSEPKGTNENGRRARGACRPSVEVVASVRTRQAGRLRPTGLREPGSLPYWAPPEATPAACRMPSVTMPTFSTPAPFAASMISTMSP